MQFIVGRGRIRTEGRDLSEGEVIPGFDSWPQHIRTSHLKSGSVLLVSDEEAERKRQELHVRDLKERYRITHADMSRAEAAYQGAERLVEDATRELMKCTDRAGLLAKELQRLKALHEAAAASLSDAQGAGSPAAASPPVSPAAPAEPEDGAEVDSGSSGYSYLTDAEAQDLTEKLSAKTAKQIREAAAENQIELPKKASKSDLITAFVAGWDLSLANQNAASQA